MKALAKRPLVISPSGNLYGSEQVLLDFLRNTSLPLAVIVPSGSLLEAEIKTIDESRFRVSTFNSKKPVSLYLGIFFALLLRSHDTVYVNEGCHVKYILTLAKFFPSAKFIIHVRILEDTSMERWSLFRGKNVTVFAISNFIRDRLPIDASLIYDPYPFRNQRAGSRQLITLSQLRIGIIGRLAKSKGLPVLVRLVELISLRQLAGRYRFILFGGLPLHETEMELAKRLSQFSNVEVKGFEAEKDKIYDSIDCVLHCSDCEPLGRIYFEALDYGKPFVGIDSAGIGEIGCLLQDKGLLVDNGEQVPERLVERLEEVMTSYNTYVARAANNKVKAEKIFSLNHYVETLDRTLA